MLGIQNLVGFCLKVTRLKENLMLFEMEDCRAEKIGTILKKERGSKNQKVLNLKVFLLHNPILFQGNNLIKNLVNF